MTTIATEREQIVSLTVDKFKSFDHVSAGELGRVNAFVGRNNAGKSSVLHALDLAGLALRWQDWSRFPLKLKLDDLFWTRGEVRLSFVTSGGKTVTISTQNRTSPLIDLGGATKEHFDTILILPDQGQHQNLLHRRAIPPKQVIDQLADRNYQNINALDILQSVYFYASRQERGFVREDYDSLIDQIQDFFPELTEIRSDRTEDLMATLNYTEYGRSLDILYAGSGLRRFLDILVKVILSKAPVVLLDEPEDGLHPELQRRFLAFIRDLAVKRDLQFFLATHSPIFLNAATDIGVYRVTNMEGVRSVVRVPPELRHTALGDLGVRASDLFQNDICLMVEGQDDIVFFEFVLNELYGSEFSGLAVAVVQYAGGAADGIVSGKLSVKNITTVQPYVHWIRDRDARPIDPPAANSKAFAAALVAAGQSVTLLSKREIEYCLPEDLYVAAQNGDAQKESIVRAVMRGDQSAKFRKALEAQGCVVPHGSVLRNLLLQFCTKSNLDAEIREIVENTLVPWAVEIRGT